MDVIIESEEELSELNTSNGDENFQELKRRHEELRKQMEEKQRHDENVEAVLQRCLFYLVGPAHSKYNNLCLFMNINVYMNDFCIRHSEKTTRPIKLEIRPTFLVPDTNGFIDHLEILQKLAESNIFTIVIPIVGKKVIMQRYNLQCKV